MPWSPRDGSLLEFAEAQGIDGAVELPLGHVRYVFDASAVRQVRYEGEVEAESKPGSTLICMARPVAGHQASVEAGVEAGVVLDL